jgi:hypothetical protein
VTLIRTLLIATALLGTTIGHGMAQERVVDTLSRAGICQQAATALNGRPNLASYANAISELPACATRGAQELRAEWEQPPSDTTAQRILGEVSPQLRDRQVFDAVLAAFRDSGRPPSIRLAALEALVGYYQPGLFVEYREPALAVNHGSAYVMVGWGDKTTTSGVSPLSTDTRGEILAALDQAERRDPDQRLRLISAYIRTRLAALS